MLAQSDALRIPLPDKSVHTIVTSPPYWGLRDYGLATWEGGDTECDHKHRTARNDGGRVNVDGFHGSAKPDSDKGAMYDDTCLKCGAIRHDSGIGLETTPDEYIASMVAVGRELWRVLRDDGSCWINLGDSYNGSGRKETQINSPKQMTNRGGTSQRGTNVPGLKPKDLCGIPWRVALALQADGWYLRSDIIWAKPNPMPESCTDRPTKAHEYVFLLTKRPRYYYDNDAIKETSVDPECHKGWGKRNEMQIHRHDPKHAATRGFHNIPEGKTYPTRNRRSVWTIATQPFSGAHFATFPEKLVEPMIRAGTSEHGVCPECGAGWKRVVEKQFRGNARKEGYDADITMGRSQMRRLSHASKDEELEYIPPKFLGWKPSCQCFCDKCRGEGIIEDVSWDPPRWINCDKCDASIYPLPVPATVLDPFCGSGTAGIVARRLGRRFVGLDLSAEYLQLARARLGLTALDDWTMGAGQVDHGDYSGLPLFDSAEGQ